MTGKRGRSAGASEGLEVFGAVLAAVSDEALWIVRTGNPCRLGKLTDQAFRPALDEAGISGRSRIEDHRTVFQNKLAVCTARPLRSWRSDLCDRGRCNEGQSKGS